MDFYIGNIDIVRDKSLLKQTLPSGMIESEIICLRRSRSEIHGELVEEERRKRKANADPGSAKILVLLIPDGYSLPGDFDGRRYKALIRLKRVP